MIIEAHRSEWQEATIISTRRAQTQLSELISSNSPRTPDWIKRKPLWRELQMISQANISPNTPMGANLVAGGATFRAWAPLANAVYIDGTFGGTPMNGQTANLLLAKDAQGYWTGFVAAAREGDPYRFWVEGPGRKGDKRDPYARELSPATSFPCGKHRGEHARDSVSRLGFRIRFPRSRLRRGQIKNYNPP
jgi:hypothetical protein